VVKYIILCGSLISANLMADGILLADPTTPLDYKITSSPKVARSALPQLQSILGNKGQRRAILNNQLYDAGQWVSGYQIMRIDSDAVLLQQNNHAYTLNLYPQKEPVVK